MPASQSDLFKKTGASTVTTLSAPGKALGATSLTVGSTTNYPTDTGIIVAIRVVDTSGNLVAGTYTEWSATVSSGTSLAIDATPVYGSDQIYAAGSTTQVFIPLSSYAHNKMVDGLLVEHGQDGKHTNINAISVKTDSIAGITDADSGDVYGITVTNGKMDGDDIADGTVTAAKMSLTHTTDANGWKVYDYGTFKQYFKNGSFTQAVDGSQWVGGVGSTGLPAGMSTLGSNFVTCAVGASDNAASPILNQFTSGSTTFTFRIGNAYSTSINPVISWSICITTV